jgi:hypothetical protein
LPAKTAIVDVNLKDSSLCALRYAAYAVSGRAHVFIKPLPGGRVRAEFSPKPGSGARPAELAAQFRLELADEKLRERVSEENQGLREFMTLKFLNYRPPAPAQDDSGLTPQQEKELNELISQIETEIKAETGGKKADPLGITSTWEDTYGAGNSKKKKR